MALTAVIFDFDGTLADSHGAISACVNLVFGELGLPPVAEERVHALVGLPLAEVLGRLMPELDAPELGRAVARYRALYPEVARPRTRLFPGMLELLHELRARRVRMAIATGKSTRGAHRAILDLKLDATLFAGVVGSDAVPRAKPHPDMVTFLLRRLEVASDHAVVVGDTTFDMEMAVSAGVAALGVTWGSHARDALVSAGAAATADSDADLRQQLFRRL